MIPAPTRPQTEEEYEPARNIPSPISKTFQRLQKEKVWIQVGHKYFLQ